MALPDERRDFVHDLQDGSHRPRRRPISRSARVVNLTLAEIGAGEGIRTLDPDLGKVVLYP